MVVRARWKPGRILCFHEPRETLVQDGAAQAPVLLLLGNGHHCQGCSGMARRGRCRACCAAWREGGGGGGCQQCRRGGQSPGAPWEVEAGVEEAKVSLPSTSRLPEIIVMIRSRSLQHTCCLVGGGLANSSTLPWPAIFFLTLST